jgi:cobalt/nickel transport system ATP-binding protein
MAEGNRSVKPAIEAVHLSFAFEHGCDVLSDINLQIASGERVSILGGNGAGKSTLVWCLAGVLRPQGELRILGQSAKAARGRVGLVFQNPEDQLFMPSIEEDLKLPLLNRGADEKEAAQLAESALQQVGLLEHAVRPASMLSYGQRKRAAIAAVLVSKPDILILDEPTAELDGRSIRELQELLAILSCTLVLVTHDVAFARRLTARSILLKSGRVIADDITEIICASAELLQEARIS